MSDRYLYHHQRYELEKEMSELKWNIEHYPHYSKNREYIEKYQKEIDNLKARLKMVKAKKVRTLLKMRVRYYTKFIEMIKKGSPK